MEPRGIVKAFPKRKKVRDDSGKSIPPKIPKEEGTEIPEGKSCMPMMWNGAPQRLPATVGAIKSYVRYVAQLVRDTVSLATELPPLCFPQQSG